MLILLQTPLFSRWSLPLKSENSQDYDASNRKKAANSRGSSKSIYWRHKPLQRIQSISKIVKNTFCTCTWINSLGWTEKSNGLIRKSFVGSVLGKHVITNSVQCLRRHYRVSLPGKGNCWSCLEEREQPRTGASLLPPHHSANQRSSIILWDDRQTPPISKCLLTLGTDSDREYWVIYGDLPLSLFLRLHVYHRTSLYWRDRGGGRGRGGTKSYDGETAWSSITNSILFA